MGTESNEALLAVIEQEVARRVETAREEGFTEGVRALAIAVQRAIDGVIRKGFSGANSIEVVTSDDIDRLRKLPDGIGAAVVRYLREAGINTIEQLLESTDNRLLRIENIGPKTKDQIDHLLNAYGGHRRRRQ